MSDSIASFENQNADKMFNYLQLDPKLRMINPNEIGFKDKFDEVRPELKTGEGGYAEQKK